MSAIVYAGAAQLLALELWTDPVPIMAAIVAAGVVNLRMAPQGAALDGVRACRRARAAGAAVVALDLPTGLQIFGPRGSDRRLLRLGQAWHRATDWPNRRPPLLQRNA
jgi:predicted branched-subunit amino acid permease